MSPATLGGKWCRRLWIFALAMIVGLWPLTVPARHSTPTPTGANLTKDELAALVAEFDDAVLIGGQAPPRFSRWVNDDVFIFFQLDNSDLNEATEVRYVGIGLKGVFCAETQPDPSFTHFHKYEAPEYGLGHGSAPHQQGYWLLWVATAAYETRDGREVVPGVDRAFSPTPPPTCGATAGTPSASATSQELVVTGTEFAFAPAELHVSNGQTVSLTFRNAGTVPHTFTLPAANVDTGSVAAGSEAKLTFTAPDEPGTYEYLCSFGGHPEAGMVGQFVIAS